MLADDPLGAQRERFEDPLPEAYFDAFGEIQRDPNNRLIVAEHEGQVVGVLQLTLIPNISYQGGWRAMIEGVRIHQQFRGEGVGQDMVLHAVEVARDRGCVMVQLTADKSRVDALRFYQQLGFRATHEGLKLWFS